MKSSNLTGKGGIALAMFHLARHNLEFHTTTESSRAGDIWVRLPTDEIISVEVKASTTGAKWNARASQLRQVKMVVLVDMNEAVCFVVAASDILALHKCAGDMFPVSWKQLPGYSREGWHLFGVPPMRECRPNMNPYPDRRRATQTVRKRLADGRIKEYTYVDGEQVSNRFVQ